MHTSYGGGAMAFAVPIQVTTMACELTDELPPVQISTSISFRRDSVCNGTESESATSR